MISLQKQSVCCNLKHLFFVEDKFDDHGKWMDGWETRRKRHAGYDWCIVKLGVSGKISALDIDTTFLQEIILLLPH